jgi:SAM-dependent methyltransferase
VYTTAQAVSITSGSKVLPIATEVFYCEACGHLQTPEMADLEQYYATNYTFYMESDEADQLYKHADGTVTYRSAHQAETLLHKVPVPQGARVLDYGCGKAATTKHLKTLRPDVVPYLFDVTESYLAFWETFAARENWACHTPNPAWEGQMDVITSYFALEHVVDPIAMLTTMHRFLAPGGYLYAIVPNWQTNVADMIVVDHTQHFSASSLRAALGATGFTVVDIDAGIHQSAYVITARKTGNVSGRAPLPPVDELQPLARKVHETASYWQDLATRIRAFEQAQGPDVTAAIYGSGVYGTFIATCLQDIERVACVFDQNPYQHGKTVRGQPVVAPEAIPETVTAVYVGLNPAIARGEMAKIDSWQGKSLTYFYL